MYLYIFCILQGVRDRYNLSMLPEDGIDRHTLSPVITHLENIDFYGHLVHEALKKVIFKYLYLFYCIYQNYSIYQSFIVFIKHSFKIIVTIPFFC